MSSPNPVLRYPRSGFTLVELAVVLVMVGVLGAFGVPRIIKSVERSKAAEAFEYLSAVRIAQERHQAQYGTYAAYLGDLDVEVTSPKYFRVPTVFVPTDSTALQDSWSLTLTRTGPSSGYGAYTVVYTEAGFDTTNSTIARSPTSRDINPISN